MPKPLSCSLKANVARLKEMFGNSADLYAKPVEVRGIPCCLCMFEGLSTLERLWVVMLSMLNESRFEPADGQELFDYIQNRTDLPVENTPVEDFDALRTQLTAGTTVMLIDNCCKAVVLSTQNPLGTGALRRRGHPWLPGGLLRPCADQCEPGAPAGAH